MMGSVYTDAAQSFRNQKGGAFIIDDFEDGNLNVYPLWWRFGVVNADIDINRPKEAPYLGRYSLRLTGDANEWYVGGVGTYLGIDADKYNSVKFIIKGNGEKSGTLIFELYDDDDNSWEVSTHSQYPSQVTGADKFIYTQKVNWEGWKVVMIPLAHFSDVNPGIGDDKWNPNIKNGSGGLLQMQMILMAVDKYVDPDIRIDSVRFFKKPKLKAFPQKKGPHFTDWM